MNISRNQKLDTESKILQVAEKEFLEKGYEGAKTTSIAEAAGVTHAMLHYYFRTKEKLFEKIATEKIKKLSEIMFGVVGNSDLPLKERITQGIESHFDFIAANQSLPRFIFNELHLHPEKCEAIKENIASIAITTVENLQHEINVHAQKGECKKVDARMLLMDIASLNIFPFLASPIISTAFGPLFKNREEFLEIRKKEIVKTILEKLNIH